MPICPSCSAIYEMKYEACPRCGTPKPARYEPEPIGQRLYKSGRPRSRWSKAAREKWRCGLFLVICMYFALVASFFVICSTVWIGYLLISDEEWKLAFYTLGIQLPVQIGAFMVVYMAILFARNE